MDGILSSRRQERGARGFQTSGSLWAQLGQSRHNAVTLGIPSSTSFPSLVKVNAELNEPVCPSFVYGSTSLGFGFLTCKTRTIILVEWLWIWHYLKYVEVFRTVLGTKRAHNVFESVILIIVLIATGQEQPNRYGPKDFIYVLLLQNVAWGRIRITAIPNDADYPQVLTACS